MTGDLPDTERIDETTAHLDRLDARGVVAAIAGAQQRAVDAVLAQTEALGALVERAVAAIAAGNAVHYVGAGTSGRLGVLDASEMPPTFGTDPSLLCAHIAGGERALRNPVEGAEDDRSAGAAEMQGHVRRGDIVIGISASGSAPYVAAALEAARGAGAFAAAIVDVTGPCALSNIADLTIVLQTGAEPLSGSTRLTAGTAAKIALNAFSTATMVRLGKVYENLMVDVVASNDKLRRRALRLVQLAGGVDESRAAQLLADAGGNAKTAIVMARMNVDAAQARARLEASGGLLRVAIA